MSSREDSEAVLETRPAAMVAEADNRASAESNYLDTSISDLSTRMWWSADAAEHSDGSNVSRDKRCSAGAFRLVFVADEGVVGGHAQWGIPKSNSRLGAAQPP